MRHLNALVVLPLGFLFGSLFNSAAVLGQENKGEEVNLGGLKSKTPADWKQETLTPAQKQMGRLMQFRIPKAGDDKQDAELFVFYLQGQGGSVDENVKRWKQMFVPPQGKSLDEATKVEKFKVGNVGVTSVDVQGTYKFKKAPFVPDDQAELRPNYRMIAVYFDHKEGPYFIRFVGPARTIEQHKNGFDEWLKGFK
jgi:hypothetical protein